MRLLDMYGVAAEMWTSLQAADPATAALMQAYADGISAYFQAVKDKKVTGPIEWTFLGTWEPWTPVDSLAMGRLQSWDLSFSHYIDEIEMATLMAGLVLTFIVYGFGRNLGHNVFQALVADRFDGDARSRALYFSRAPIPFARDALAGFPQRLPDTLPDALAGTVLRHVGLYAYRVSFLRAYRALAPSPIESIEALEQLRALWHGHRIVVATTDEAPPAGVDTTTDMSRRAKS